MLSGNYKLVLSVLLITAITACGGGQSSSSLDNDTNETVDTPTNSQSSSSSSTASSAPNQICTTCQTGTHYYVSRAGNDTQNGHSTETAWQTIARVNQQNLVPGDTVLFRRGDTWRETLYLEQSGSDEQWIMYGAYGEGEKPRILGSEQALEWTHVTGNIWQSATHLQNPYSGGYSYGEVFFEHNDSRVSWGRQRDFDISYANLEREYDWAWSDSRLYVFAATNPSQRYFAVEAPQRDGSIRFANIDNTNDDPLENIAIDNLDLRYAMRWGIYGGYNEVEASGIRITSNHIGYIGVKGGASAYCISNWRSDMLIQNNSIHDCGRRGVSINTYTHFTANLQVQNITLDSNHFYNGYHTTSVDVSSLPELGHSISNIVFSNNLVDDSQRHSTAINDGCAANSCTSNAYYVAASSGNHYSNFTVFNNRFIGSTSRAILISGIVEGVKIYHNSIFGSHPDAFPYALVTLNNIYNVDMRNNIIHGNLPAEIEGRCVLDENSTSFSLRDYNLYFQEDDNQPFSGSENGVGGWSTYATEWDNWRDASGFESNSPAPQNPLFTHAQNGTLSLQVHSPAIDAGDNISGFNDDFRGNAPDLGAFESDY